jgi:hypothetical protein
VTSARNTPPRRDSGTTDDLAGAATAGRLADELTEQHGDHAPLLRSPVRPDGNLLCAAHGHARPPRRTRQRQCGIAIGVSTRAGSSRPSTRPWPSRRSGNTKPSCTSNQILYKALASRDVIGQAKDNLMETPDHP